jgi:hypothetical protein
MHKTALYEALKNITPAQMDFLRFSGLTAGGTAAGAALDPEKRYRGALIGLGAGAFGGASTLVKPQLLKESPITRNVLRGTGFVGAGVGGGFMGSNVANVVDNLKQKVAPKPSVQLDPEIQQMVDAGVLPKEMIPHMNMDQVGMPKTSATVPNTGYSRKSKTAGFEGTSTDNGFGGMPTGNNKTIPEIGTPPTTKHGANDSYSLTTSPDGKTTTQTSETEYRMGRDQYGNVDPRYDYKKNADGSESFTVKKKPYWQRDAFQDDDEDINTTTAKQNPANNQAPAKNAWGLDTVDRTKPATNTPAPGKNAWGYDDKTAAKQNPAPAANPNPNAQTEAAIKSNIEGQVGIDRNNLWGSAKNLYNYGWDKAGVIGRGTTHNAKDAVLEGGQNAVDPEALYSASPKTIMNNAGTAVKNLFTGKTPWDPETFMTDQAKRVQASAGSAITPAQVEGARANMAIRKATTDPNVQKTWEKENPWTSLATGGAKSETIQREMSKGIINNSKVQDLQGTIKTEAKDAAMDWAKNNWGLLLGGGLALGAAGLAIFGGGGRAAQQNPANKRGPKSVYDNQEYDAEKWNDPNANMSATGGKNAWGL